MRPRRYRNSSERAVRVTVWLAVRTDRRSAYEAHGLSVRDGPKPQWLNGVSVMAEAVQAAGVFTAGKGRHGSFADI